MAKSDNSDKPKPRVPSEDEKMVTGALIALHMKRNGSSKQGAVTQGCAWEN